jgi:hypothetical protein
LSGGGEEELASGVGVVEAQLCELLVELCFECDVVVVEVACVDIEGKRRRCAAEFSLRLSFSWVVHPTLPCREVAALRLFVTGLDG